MSPGGLFVVVGAHMGAHVDSVAERQPATQMLTNTMFLWTRLFASQLASTASRTATTRYAHLHRYAPLALSSRRFSTGNPTILAAATTAEKKPDGSSSPAKKPTRKVAVKATKKAKTASPKKSKDGTKVKSKAKKATASKKATSTRVPLKDRPPTRPPVAFFLFLRRNFNPAGKTMSESQNATKDLGAAWRNMTEAEKQPFINEHRILMDDYRVRRDKWYKDPNNLAILRTLNKDREKRGKTRIHAPSSVTAGKKKPLTPFFRYLQELRGTDFFSRENTPPGTSWATWCAREGGARWRALPDAEKQKYTEAYQNELDKST